MEFPQQNRLINRKMNNNQFLLSIIIPAKNELENLKILINEIIHELPHDLDYEIIIVNHNSTDKTAQYLHKLEMKENILRVININNEKYLFGPVMKYAFQKSKGGLILTMDGDLSHLAKFIPDFLRCLKKGSDVVIGGRYQKNQRPFHPKSRFILIKLFNIFVKIFINSRINDFTTGYRAFDRSLLKEFDLISSHLNFHLELNIKLIRHAKNPTDIPIRYQKRRYGSSKFDYTFLFIQYLKSLFWGLFG